ncbi:hypothetical protein QI178_04525 [Staphylococcus saprophyticus]|nr:hypothetical protein [Staphylococcus saprophyticus]
MSIRELSLSFHHQEIKIKLPKNYFKTNGKSYPLVIVQDGDYLFKDVKKDVIFVGIVPNNRKKIIHPGKVLLVILNMVVKRMRISLGWLMR